MVKRREQTADEMETALESAMSNDLGGVTQPAQEETAPTSEAGRYLGQTLNYKRKEKQVNSDIEDAKDRLNLTRIGERIGQNNEIREGWISVDRAMLGARDVFYPQDWEFRIKPATVEAIRNWSTIDDENPNSIDTVFDEILKSCLSIKTQRGPLPWNNINVWDRFFFILLIREATMINGEKKVEFYRECSNCEVEVKFELNSLSLMYDVPEDDVMNYYDRDTRTWSIVPSDFDVTYAGDYIQLYLPTREKDANIKAWAVSKLQEDRQAKLNHVFIKFLPWMLPKISKDLTIAKNQIRKAETEFKSWGPEMFSFMDNVLKNIMVTPGSNLVATCPSCGEEVTAPLQFPGGISALFDMADRFKKFGKK